MAERADDHRGLWPAGDLASPGEPMAATAWLLYDGDCRVCTAFARAVHALDLRHRVSIRPLQEAREILPALPSEQILDAMRFVAVDGSTTAAEDALIALLAALAGSKDLEPLLRRSRLVARSARWFYATLVELRGHLICRMPATGGAPVAR